MRIDDDAEDQRHKMMEARHDTSSAADIIPNSTAKPVFVKKKDRLTSQIGRGGQSGSLTKRRNNNQKRSMVSGISSTTEQLESKPNQQGDADEVMKEVEEEEYRADCFND